MSQSIHLSIDANNASSIAPKGHNKKGKTIIIKANQIM